MRNKILLLMGFGLFVMTDIAIAANEKSINQFGTCNTQKLNVREAPNTKGKILFTISDKERVFVSNINEDRWCNIVVNQDSNLSNGFVKCKNITFKNSEIYLSPTFFEEKKEGVDKIVEPKKGKVANTTSTTSKEKKNLEAKINELQTTLNGSLAEQEKLKKAVEFLIQDVNALKKIRP